MTTELRPRILLADDYPALLSAWRRLLKPSYDIVAEVSDGEAALEAATALKPDVVVLDLSMPLKDGFEVCRAIRHASASTKVVLVTASADPALAHAAFRGGASAFVMKQLASDDLPVAIRAALSGETYCSSFSTERRLNH